MARRVVNVHERRIAAPAEEVGALVDGLGSPADVLWPAPTWLPVRFDRPLQVGADGGHGSIRYEVSGYEPGRRVELTFRPETGLHGTHTLEVEPSGDGGCLLRHRLEAETSGAMRLLWPLLVRHCHDTVLEHLLDNAQRETGERVRPVRYSRRARWAAAVETTRVRGAAVPAEATLLTAALAPPYDLADAFSVQVPPGTCTEPDAWAEAVFRRPPGWVVSLLHLRNRLVGLLGIAPGDRSDFDTLARDRREAVLGVDAGHLDFRASVLVSPTEDATTVTVSTVAVSRSFAGRVYLLPVRALHPLVVRAMLRRAAREMTAPPTGTTARPTSRVR